MWTWDRFHLLFGGYRAEYGRAIARIAHPDCPSARDEPLDDFIVNRFPGPARASRPSTLSGVEEDARRRGFGSGIEIGMVEDDIGGLAARLERDPFEIAHNPRGPGFKSRA
jgi:hypothetical protein